jgi:hypothetical protein
MSGKPFVMIGTIFLVVGLIMPLVGTQAGAQAPAVSVLATKFIDAASLPEKVSVPVGAHVCVAYDPNVYLSYFNVARQRMQGGPIARTTLRGSDPPAGKVAPFCFEATARGIEVITVLARSKSNPDKLIQTPVLIAVG